MMNAEAMREQALNDALEQRLLDQIADDEAKKASFDGESRYRENCCPFCLNEEVLVEEIASEFEGCNCTACNEVWVQSE